MKKVSLLCLCGAVLLGFGVTDNVSAQTTMGTIKVPVGATGKSAYQIWKEAGNTGSEADFLASLVGATGAAGQDGAPGCADKVDISDKNAQSCYTITKTPYSLVSGTCTAGTPVNKLVCDGAPGTNGTNCEPTFSSAHDVTNKKTVVTISGCGSTSTVDIPDGQDGNDGAPGTNGVGICDNVANPATAVKTYTKTYTAPTATKAGYVRLAQTMCNNTTNNTDYEDTCVPVVSSNKDICSGNSGMYMECVRQDTSAVYNICRPITTQNASAISTAIDAAQTAADNAGTAAASAGSKADSALLAAQTAQNTADGKVDTTTFTSYQTTVASTYANKDDVYNKTQVDSAISTATANKITATEVDNKITTATANLANKTYVDDAVANKVTSSDVNSAISTALGDYSTTAQMNTALANKADTSALSSYLQTANLGTALKANSVKTDLADAVAGSGALTGYLTSADASSTYATQTALNTADGKITALETTVGDSNGGLVKQVATNTSTIGNASGGLVKDVADAKTSAANAVSTANTASTNATQAKQDAASALSGLDDKLNKTDAQSTYLSKTDATSTYLKQADASSTYLTQNNASSTYATKSALTTVETTANNAATTASSALTTANTASGNATRALNKATTNETNISSLNTTVSGHTTSIGSLQTSVSTNTSSLTSLSNRLNGNCSSSGSKEEGTRSSTGSDSGSTAGTGDHGEVCGMSIEDRIAALETAVAALQNN
jgi:hypothetical protein